MFKILINDIKTQLAILLACLIVSIIGCAIIAFAFHIVLLIYWIFNKAQDFYSDNAISFSILFCVILTGLFYVGNFIKDYFISLKARAKQKYEATDGTT